MALQLHGCSCGELKLPSVVHDCRYRYCAVCGKIYNRLNPGVRLQHSDSVVLCTGCLSVYQRELLDTRFPSLPVSESIKVILSSIRYNFVGLLDECDNDLLIYRTDKDHAEYAWCFWRPGIEDLCISKGHRVVGILHADLRFSECDDWLTNH